MMVFSFWIIALGYPLSSLAATVGGPRGLRPAAAGILVVTVLTTLIGLAPQESRPGHEVIDIGSSFILAMWILVVAFAYPTLWSGTLLILQSLELALAGLALGPDHEALLSSAPFETAVFGISLAIIGLLSLAVVAKQSSLLARARQAPRTA